MRSRVAFWAAIVLLNLALACAALALAPREVGTTADRLGYEYVMQHPLAADCPHNIFCYRLLVPSLLAHVPGSEVAVWRGYSVAANTATGVLLAGLAVVLSGTWSAGLLASILFQTSFGATFALFDPFTPDAAVYLLAALLALCWWFDRPWLGLALGLLGVFAKETVALAVVAAALAALLQQQSGSDARTKLRGTRRPWLIAAALVCVTIVGFHAFMDAFAGWTERGSASADLLGGAWLGRWLADPTLTPAAHVFYLFIPFAFGWLYAALGFSHSPRRMRLLAIGAVMPILLLVYVQTPERALATASFVVVPLAAAYLSRAPRLLAFVAAIANGLLTARVGLSTPVLPPISYLLLLAGATAAVTVLWPRIAPRASATLSTSSSRIPSVR